MLKLIVIHLQTFDLTNIYSIMLLLFITFF